jgi:hypothetical protein
LSFAKSRRRERETVKKRSIHEVCEHFEPFRNTAMGTYIVFEIGSHNNREKGEYTAKEKFL